MTKEVNTKEVFYELSKREKFWCSQSNAIHQNFRYSHFLIRFTFIFFWFVAVQLFMINKCWNKGHEKLTITSNNRSTQTDCFCNFQYIFIFGLQFTHILSELWMIDLANKNLNLRVNERQMAHRVKAGFKRKGNMCIQIYR